MTIVSDRSMFVRRLAVQLSNRGKAPSGVEEFDGGMAKRSYRVTFHGEELVIQLRAAVPFYEPVPEACDAWIASGYETLPILEHGLIRDGHRYYAFPYFPWPSASSVLLQLRSADAINLAERIGSIFAALNSVPAEGYGEYLTGLIGKYASWCGFILHRCKFYLNHLVSCDIISEMQEKYIVSMLASELREPECSRLIYVDVKTDNVLVSQANYQIVIIDYDYLLAGDPIFSAGRWRPLYGDSDTTKALLRGFFSVYESNLQLLLLYELVHVLELLYTPPTTKALIARRSRLLEFLSRLTEETRSVMEL